MCVCVSAGGGATSSSPADVTTVARLHDDAQLALGHYVAAARPAGGEVFGPSPPPPPPHRHRRLGHLLLLVGALPSVSAETIERLYFRSTLGDVAVARLVADVYASAVDV